MDLENKVCTTLNASFVRTKFFQSSRELQKRDGSSHRLARSSREHCWGRSIDMNDANDERVGEIIHPSLVLQILVLISRRCGTASMPTYRCTTSGTFGAALRRRLRRHAFDVSWVSAGGGSSRSARRP